MSPRWRALLLAAPTAVSLLASNRLAAQDTTAVGGAEPPTDSVVVPPPVIPVDEPSVPVGPLPPGTRYAFTHDSIMWVRGLTLSDLLAAIPGVYIARAGFLGQPEYIAYGGRGGASIEVYWDGMLVNPLGGDSLFIDPGQVQLTYLERVDVLVSPSRLTIYLVTAQHDRVEPRTELTVGTGDFNTGKFAGLFQKRWTSGLGVNLAADFVGTDGASGPGRGDQTFDVWARVDLHPSNKTQASWQLRRQRQERDAVGTGPDVPRRFGTRTDILVRLASGGEPHGMGLRAEALLASSSWTSDSLVADQHVRQARLTLRYRRPTSTLELTGLLGDARITSGVQGSVGWVPFQGLVVSGSGRWQRHEGDRTSKGAMGSVGLYRGAFSLVGTVELRDAVQAPAILSDSAQRTLDRSIRAGLELGALRGHVGLVRRDRFLPLPYPDLRVIPGVDTSQAATYVVANIRWATSQALAFTAWYSTPASGGSADLQPPKHGRAEITLRSKFWKTFRSGAFDLKAQVAMESWSTGRAGLDDSGQPITFVGATFYETFLQFQIAGFAGFWRFQNVYNSTLPFVPGLRFPRSVQTFGVKWRFSN
ncbi:MAG: TonB-dependent receptor [Gemmatimonadales bacterium]